MAGFNVPWTEILKFFLTSHIDFSFISGQGGDNCKQNLILERKVGVTECPRPLNPGGNAMTMAICLIIVHVIS